MVKKLLALILLLATTTIYAQTRPGSLRGTITDAQNGETVPFANVVIKDQGGAVVAGGASDLDGKYNINPVNAGTYIVEVSFTGYATITTTDFIITPNTATVQNFKMQVESEALQEVTIVYEAPIIDPTKSSKITTSEDIVNMAVRDITSVAAQAAGVTVNANGGTNIRGARDEGTVYFIDGVKVRGSANIPQAAIAQTEVITGGLPAQYGDAVGGVISTTTKGPSSQYFGTAEILTSSPFNWKAFGDGPIDPQNYNLAAFTLGGPIPVWKDENGNPRVGFLLSAEYQYMDDTRPSIVPYTEVNEDTLKSLQERPITIDSSGSGYINRAELIDDRSLSNVYTRKNGFNSEFRLNGNIQLKPTKNTTLTVGGRWVFSDDKRNTFNNHIFNYENNLDQRNSDWSTYLRFQQQFANDPESTSNIKNAFYTIQVDYSQANNLIHNEELGENFFEYGHVGNFDIQRTPIYQYGVDTITGVAGYRYINDQDTAVKFTPGTSNPVLSNYMSTYYDLAASNPGIDVSDFSTLVSSQAPAINGQNPLSVYNNLWGNLGAVQSVNANGVTGANYYKSRESQFRVTASTSFDIKDHSIIVGAEYEQRNVRAYALDATGLWSQARLFQNAPNAELDFSNPHLVEDAFGFYQDTINYDRAYSSQDASAFAENIRRALGMDPYSTEVINIDNLDPSVFSIDMFSPDEMINPNGTRYLHYYGYDYTGEIVTDKVDISDFFLAKSDDGRFARPVGSFQPIYMAGYIQDQFTFNDLTFNIGVRVDRFDLNQEVLKDPYILYPFYTVEDIPNTALASESVPASIGSDYRVYVSSYEYQSATIVGYRDGDNWFNAAGEPLANPNELAIAAGGQIKPFTVSTPTERTADETNQGGKYIPKESFEDYAPQTVVMPRIAFNFPITDEAIFIAHYDLLAQRPTSSISRLDPFDYLGLINSSAGTGALNNPNLAPQKTTEYELGFKQALSDKTAIKISAFYRELRDLIQTVNYTQAYPIEYIAYGNRDFGTVKGFSLEYEMRRTKNVKLDANYTLQFADGTGSSATSGLNLARAGQPNLRYILPLSYDNRHQLLLRVDYRYGKGSAYNGPVWWNTKVFESFGVNLTLNAQSGAPYTKRDQPYIVTTVNPSSVALVEGGINGRRLPWQYTVDARINRVFDLGESKKTSLEVYLQILNLLNTKNVIDVYDYTGSPDDDGYLASTEAQSQLAQQTSSTAFVDLYNRNIVNGFNYSLPRRIRLGIAYNF
ncbi:TonB-dependent receptor domain-containing protein [Owenweeksia hongkongensis]|uniref:TonB-dependent receptor n=1 Tax=Owenweeksia hongkongensis TaxID=253245 RepID=UPI003A8FFBF2